MFLYLHLISTVCYLMHNDMVVIASSMANVEFGMVLAALQAGELGKRVISTLHNHVNVFSSLNVLECFSFLPD